MKLKYNNYVRNNVVYIDLETSEFTEREMNAFYKFGEPVVSFHESYGTPDGDGVYPFRVDIERKVKTSFRFRAKFDGSVNLDDAINAANLFFEDIKMKLEEVMLDIMNKLSELEIDFIVESGVHDITFD